ncbi:hypothetical protein ENC_36450 [Enterobacter hormaechei]|jgi:hypothetical protein|nr:hypothetical protein ENC_36450 [Enterobacter hormaechei]
MMDELLEIKDATLAAGRAAPGAVMRGSVITGN